MDGTPAPFSWRLYNKTRIDTQRLLVNSIHTHNIFLTSMIIFFIFQPVNVFLDALFSTNTLTLTNFLLRT